MNRTIWGKGRTVVAIIVVLLVSIVLPGKGFSQDIDPQCRASRDKWEQAYQDLKDKLSSFLAIQQLPVERVAQRPLVSSSSGGTIASQIAEALQAKENVLDSKRKECQNLLNLENQLFTELQDCVSSGRSGKHRDINAIQKKRRALVDKAVPALAEIQEVEGRETILPYSEASSDPYRRSVNNYWQNYENMYRRWWGY